MTATVMMGAMLKGENKLTVKIEGGGPIGAIIADGNAKVRCADMSQTHKFTLI